MDEFNKLLTEYKNQYLDFLATGGAEYKAAYQRVMSEIESMISAKRQEVDAQKSSMKHFVKSYAEDNRDLGGMVEDAQQLHDQYQTSKNRYEAWTEDSKIPKAPVLDISNGYSIMLRFGIFLILIPVLILVGWFTGGHHAMPSMRSINITQPSPFFGPNALHNQ